MRGKNVYIILSYNIYLMVIIKKFLILIFSGDFKFDKIGSQYNSSVPIFAMRSVPALTGSMLIPLVYMIMIQLNYSQWTAALAAFLFLFGLIKISIRLIKCGF